MAYNNFFPQYYPSAFQQMLPQNTQNQQQQMQNGGFMIVPNEDVARNYPVALGNCVTFKIEGKPIVMEKSMGFSQLEPPRIDRYRLVREEDMPNEQISAQNTPQISEIENKSIDDLKRQIKALNNGVKYSNEKICIFSAKR